MIPVRRTGREIGASCSVTDVFLRRCSSQRKIPESGANAPHQKRRYDPGTRGGSTELIVGNKRHPLYDKHAQGRVYDREKTNRRTRH